MTWKDKLKSILHTLPFSIYGKILILSTTILIIIALFTTKSNLTIIMHLAVVINVALLIIIYSNLRDKIVYFKTYYGVFNKELQIWARVFLAQLSFSIALFILSYAFSIEIVPKTLIYDSFLVYYMFFESLTFLLIILSAGFVFKQKGEENYYLTGFLLLLSISFFSQFFNSTNPTIKMIVMLLIISILFFLFIYSLRFYYKEELVKSFAFSVYGFIIVLILNRLFNILELTGISLIVNHTFFVIILVLYSSMILGLDYRLNYLTSSQA